MIFIYELEFYGIFIMIEHLNLYDETPVAQPFPSSPHLPPLPLPVPPVAAVAAQKAVAPTERTDAMVAPAAQGAMSTVLPTWQDSHLRG